MNAAAHRVEGNAKVPVLYMALERSDKTWKVVSGEVCQSCVGWGSSYSRGDY